MMAAIIAGLTFFGQLLKLGAEIYLTVKLAKQKDSDEIKRKKTELIQSGVRALIDNDGTRYVAALDGLRSLKQNGNQSA